MALILVENFDNADALRHIAGTLTLLEGSGKGESNACKLITSNQISFTPSKKVVLGFYVKNYTSEYVSFGNPTGGESFRITFAKSIDGKVTISFYNPRQTYISNYPVINNQVGYQDTDSGYSLIEIELDLTNASAHEGVLKIAIDGITYVDLNDVVNAPIDLWTSELNSESARYSWIAFDDFIVDSLYICNEAKGFNNSFFGPYDITTLYPLRDGDQTNWEQREYSSPVPYLEGMGNTPSVTKIPFDIGSADIKNVIASQTLTRDLFFFSSDGLPDDNVIIKGIEQRVWHKGLSAEQNNQLCVITPIAKATGRDIETVTEYEHLSKAFYFKQMRTPFDVLPTVSTPWTQEGLDFTQFGYCFYETFQTEAISKAVITSQDIVSGVLANLTDGDSATFIRATTAYFTFAIPIKIKQLQFLVNSSSAISSIKLYDFAGKEYPMNAPSTLSNLLTVTNHEDHLLKDIIKIRVNLHSSYNVYSASIAEWAKVK